MHALLKYSKQLEFDKVLARVSALAVCEKSRERLSELCPCDNVPQARAALALTDALLRMVVHNGAPAVVAVSEIDRLAMRAEKGGALSMSELLTVARMLKNARVLKSWYSEGGESDCPGAEQLFFALYRNDGFERRIDECILSEDTMADGASTALADIRRKIARTESSIRDKLDSIVKGNSQKFLQEAIVTMRGGRFVVPVKSEHRGDVKGLVHDVSASGSTYFVEPAAVLEANNHIVALKADEQKEIERILYELTAEIAGFAEQLNASYAAFIDIDMSLAKARYALSIDGAVPEFSDDGIIDLKKARHPLIDKNKVVPIDIAVGSNYTTLVITGPNTGGKTVTLKTVGLLSLMAACGMPVSAAAGSRLCLLDGILVDIGDEQSIEQSLSTFSGHITNIIEILKQADSGSLVLLDELGAGTDPAEGAALAVAILDELRARGCLVIATTHFGEMKLYALDTDGVQNASCEFDVATLRPTYRIHIGVPGRSNAFLIGERLGLPESIISAARENMSHETRSFEDVLGQIEQIKSEIGTKSEAADSAAAQAREELKKAREEAQRIRSEAQKELFRAQERAKQLVADVSARAETLNRELRDVEKNAAKDSKAAVARARAIARSDSAKLYDLTEPVTHIDQRELKPLESAKVGDEVFIRALGQVAKVVKAADAKGQLEVAAGNLHTRVKLSELAALPQDMPHKKKKASEYIPQAPGEGRKAQNEINVIGLDTEEATLEVERFLDDAVLAKLNTVYVIHGRGTGALRGAIQRRLKQLKFVKSFRLGAFGEGEDGVTVVELK